MTAATRTINDVGMQLVTVTAVGEQIIFACFDYNILSSNQHQGRKIMCSRIHTQIKLEIHVQTHSIFACSEIHVYLSEGPVVG